MSRDVARQRWRQSIFGWVTITCAIAGNVISHIGNLAPTIFDLVSLALVLQGASLLVGQQYPKRATMLAGVGGAALFLFFILLFLQRR